MNPGGAEENKNVTKCFSLFYFPLLLNQPSQQCEGGDLILIASNFSCNTNVFLFLMTHYRSARSHAWNNETHAYINKLSVQYVVGQKKTSFILMQNFTGPVFRYGVIQCECGDSVSQAKYKRLVFFAQLIE